MRHLNPREARFLSLVIGHPLGIDEPTARDADSYSYGRALARGFVEVGYSDGARRVTITERGAVWLAMFEARPGARAMLHGPIPYFRIFVDSLRILLVDRHGTAAVHNWLNTIRAEKARRRGEI